MRSKVIIDCPNSIIPEVDVFPSPKHDQQNYSDDQNKDQRRAGSNPKIGSVGSGSRRDRWHEKWIEVDLRDQNVAVAPGSDDFISANQRTSSQVEAS
jgi:hypothetical protein